MLYQIYRYITFDLNYYIKCISCVLLIIIGLMQVVANTFIWSNLISEYIVSNELVNRERKREAGDERQRDRQTGRERDGYININFSVKWNWKIMR